MIHTGPPHGNWTATTVVLVLIGFNLFAVSYVVLTLRTFRGADPAEFRSRMALRKAAWGRTRRRLNAHELGPVHALESTTFSFVVVLVLPRIKAIRIDALLLVPLSLSILLSTWAFSIVSYALHYAQQDLDEPGLAFPGERTGAFADYRYFSIAVATTFGATDVSITTPRMRRTVNIHTILTFIYNSVIVALLASLLIQ